MAGWRCAASFLILFSMFALDSKAVTLEELKKNCTSNCTEFIKSVKETNSSLTYSVEYVYASNDSVSLTYIGYLKENMHCAYNFWSSWWNECCDCFKSNTTQDNTTPISNYTTTTPTTSTLSTTRHVAILGDEMSAMNAAVLESPISPTNFQDTTINAKMLFIPNMKINQTFSCTVINFIDTTPVILCQEAKPVTSHTSPIGAFNLMDETPGWVKTSGTSSECPLGNLRIVYDTSLSCARFNTPEAFKNTMDTAFYTAEVYFNYKLPPEYNGAKHYAGMNEICRRCNGSNHECCKTVKFLPYSDPNTCCSGVYASCQNAKVILRSCQPDRMNKYVWFDTSGNFTCVDKPKNMRGIQCC